MTDVVQHELRRLAASQRGLFSAAQAAGLGAGHNWLYRAVSRGQLRRVRRGVYAVAGTPPSSWEPTIAAALSAGPGAVVSHSTAASAHGLCCAPPVPSQFEVTVPVAACPRLPGVTSHRRVPVPPCDVVTKWGVKMTAPARTLVDIAGRLDRPLLGRVIDEGILGRLWLPVEISRCLDRCPPRSPGRKVLAELLELRMERPNADSVLEVRAFQALRPLRPFVVHHEVTVGAKTYLIDAAWPDHLVGAEVVGRAVRLGSRSAFDRERSKLNALSGAGWRIAHLTASMSADDMVSAVRTVAGDRWDVPVTAGTCR